MKFDQTYIAIRRRSALEIFDLSAHALRKHLGPFLLLLFLGALPWMVINYLLIGWMIRPKDDVDPTIGSQAAYWWCMLMLVMSEANFATAFITKYLGDATFIGRPSIKTTVVAVLRSLGDLFVVHFIVRCLLFLILAALLLLVETKEARVFAYAFAIPTLLFISMLVRYIRPFANEMILLEKTPLGGRVVEGRVSYAERSRSLHGHSDIFVRSVCIGLVTPAIYIVLCGITWLTELGFRGEWDWVTQVVLIPIAMWLTAGVVAVIRFLTYIDARIYQEGWDVELKIRAEAVKLKEKLFV